MSLHTWMFRVHLWAMFSNDSILTANVWEELDEEDEEEEEVEEEEEEVE